MTFPANNGVLLGASAPDVEWVIAAWLAPLGRAGNAYRVGDPLPFRLISRITGTEDVFCGLDDPVISVHTLCDKLLGYQAASTEATKTHQAMLELGRYLDDITMPDNTVVSIDYLKVFMSPIWLRFEDVMILRKVGRYTIGTTYNPPVIA
jgi:hypothetical protein